MQRAHPINVALLVFLAFAISCGIATAQAPATEPTTQEIAAQEAAELAKQKKEREEERERLPKVDARSFRDVAQFAIENDDLVLRTSIPPTEMAAILVDGADGFTTLGVEPAAGAKAPYAPGLFRFMRHQFPGSGGIAITHVTVIGPKTQISKSFEIDGEFQNVDLIQSDEYLEEGEGDRVRFYVQATRNDEPVDDLKLSAANVVELRRKYPAQTMRYLEPIFHDFGQASVLFQVNPRAAWQALGASHEPAAELTKQVDDLLKGLDAESAKDRAAALAQLEKIGQPAALVLMKRDRKGLSEEQQTRVETFLAPFKPLSDEEAAKMRADPEFLLLALSSEDPALSGLALEQLKGVAKQPITFDLNATGKARTDAVAQLRAQLLPATTRPATTKASVERGSTELAPDAP
ncbi:MAG: hypothetical protein WBD40_15940 [Tepidisphaeraceae bacterium]